MTMLAAKTIASNSLPVIDIAGLAGDFAARRLVAHQLRAACVDTGFFYIKGHGTPPSLIETLFHQSRTFFALPMEQKLALAMANSPCRHGYEPLKAQTLESGAPPDLKEGYLAGEDLAADHPAALNDPGNVGPNQWPPQLPSFKEVMISYLAEMKGLTKTLMRGLALSLDLEEDYFDDFCRDPVLTLRLLHYPPQPANPAPNEKGCGAHTDWGGLRSSCRTTPVDCKFGTPTARGFRRRRLPGLSWSILVICSPAGPTISIVQRFTAWSMLRAVIATQCRSFSTGVRTTWCPASRRARVKGAISRIPPFAVISKKWFGALMRRRCEEREKVRMRASCSGPEGTDG